MIAVELDLSTHTVSNNPAVTLFCGDRQTISGSTRRR